MLDSIIKLRNGPSLVSAFANELIFKFSVLGHGMHQNITLTQPFYGFLDFVWDNPGEPLAKETFTHSHLLCLSIIPYLLPSSIMIHSNLPVQFTCFAVFFHNFCSSFLCLAPFTPYSIHFFIQSLSSFRRTCPYHCNLFCCNTEIMSSNSSVSLNPSLELYLVA